MDQYYTVTTVSDRRLANIICTALEDEQVPVMVEYVQGSSSDGNQGFRILVPTQSVQNATRIARLASERFTTQSHRAKEWS